MMNPLILDVCRPFSDEPCEKVGMASIATHHGELLQGMFLNENKNFVYGLVTLTCPLFKATAQFICQPQTGVTVFPADKTKAKIAAELTLQYFGYTALGGELHLKSDIPVGKGLGSSTADVSATILAVANALGKTISRERIGQLSVTAEVASDPLSYNEQAILFAQRSGKVIEDFGASLPSLLVLGFDCASTPETGIDTITRSPQNYTCDDKRTFRLLRSLLRHAIIHKNRALIGQVSSKSAFVNQKYLPKDNFLSFLNIQETIGALGIQVAHSGTVASFLFDPTDTKVSSKIKTGISKLHHMGIHNTYEFLTKSD